MVAARDARSFWLSGRVIECGLLSGLIVRHFQKPRAGMVISGLGPNLSGELVARSPKLVFPIQIYSIILPIRGVDFLDYSFFVFNFLVAVRQAVAACAVSR